MMFLVDTNIWLELLLEQDKANEVREFLETVEADFLAITEFSLYSIGIILVRLGQDKIFLDFLSDIIENAQIVRIYPGIDDLKKIPAVCRQFNLDFDDACQYISSKSRNCILVSFDKDFDRTDQERKSPSAALKMFQDEIREI